MAPTATQTSKGVTSDIEELVEQGQSYFDEASEALAKYKHFSQLGKRTYDQIAALATKRSQEIGEADLDASAATVTAHPTGPKPKGSAAAAVTAKSTGPKPKGSMAKKTKGDTPLNSIIWDVLNRDPKAHKKHFPDYPEGSFGLKPAEIKQVVNNEGIYQTAAKDITQMVAQVLSHFKREGRIHKGEDGRYFIVDGAEHDL